MWSERNADFFKKTLSPPPAMLSSLLLNLVLILISPIFTYV